MFALGASAENTFQFLLFSSSWLQADLIAKLTKIEYEGYTRENCKRQGPRSYFKSDGADNNNNNI